MPDTTDNEFWSATEHLRLIYRWARASYVAPWALLYAVLLRAIATTGPGVMLPGPPAPASLNMGVVLVGRSGAGKGVTDKLSRIVWPADIHEEGLGSGQGIAELFKEQKNPEDRITRALFSVSEIDHLAALNAGQGNNTRAALKAALTGDRLGSKGASSATTRSVPADSYRLCLSISAQFGHTAVLMDDVSGGSPQRMLWASVSDTGMPDEPGPTPDRVLDTALPSWAQSGAQVLMQYGPPEIREYINAGLLANGRGIGEAIDGHRTLVRLKVAAALAILDQRSVVSASDWDLSEVIMAKSDATRDAVLEYDRRAARERVRSKAIARATGEDFYDASRLETVKRSIVRMLDRDGEQAGGDLRRRLGKREKRELFDQAIALLETERMVSVRSGEHNSLRYRIGSPVTNEVTPQKASSDGVTSEVTRDHSGNVTNLDTRRSYEPPPSPGTCATWFTNYIADLKSNGHDTVRAFAVYEAGRAQGYEMTTLRNAASSSKLVHIARREGTAVIWCLHPDTCSHPPVRQTSQWLRQWLMANSRSDGVAPSEVIAAGALEPEKYTRAAVIRAMQSMPEVVSTGTGPTSRWCVTPANEETA